MYKTKTKLGWKEYEGERSPSPPLPPKKRSRDVIVLEFSRTSPQEGKSAAWRENKISSVKRPSNGSKREKKRKRLMMRNICGIWDYFKNSGLKRVWNLCGKRAFENTSRPSPFAQKRNGYIHALVNTSVKMLKKLGPLSISVVHYFALVPRKG